MTFDELYAAVMAILPTAEFGEDNDGQLVIYTGLRDVPLSAVTPNPKLVPFEG